MSPRCRLLSVAFCLTLLSGALAAGEPATDALGDPLPPGVIARLGTGRLCQGGVFFLTFSPNDKSLAALDHFGGLRLFDVHTGRELWRFEGPGYGGYSPQYAPVAFSPDGALVAVGCWDKMVHVFDAATGHERHNFGGLINAMIRLSFSADGRRLAAGGQASGLANGQKGESVRVWDLDAGKSLGSWGDFQCVDALAWSADGKSLFAVAQQSASQWRRTLCQWDAATGKELSRQKLPNDVSDGGILFSPGAEFIGVLRADDNFLKLLDPNVVNKPAPDDVKVCDGKTIRLLDPATGQELRRIEAPLDMLMPFIHFSGDGRALTAASSDGTVRLWQSASGKAVREFKTTPNETKQIALSSDGSLAAVYSRADEAIHIWDTTTGKELHAFTGHRAGALAVAWSRDGKTVLTTNRERGRYMPIEEWAGWSLRRWDAATGKELHVTKEDLKGEVHWTAFSPDGRLLAVVTHDGKLRMWDAGAGRQLRAWDVPTRQEPAGGLGRTRNNLVPVEGIHAPVFSADGRVLWTAAKDSILRWDVGTGDQLPVLDAKGIGWGSRVFPGGDGETMILTGQDGAGSTQAAVLQIGGTGARVVASVRMRDPDCVLSPDGRTLAVAERDGVILRETATGKSRGRLTAPPGEDANAKSWFAHDRVLAFSPDGRFLAYGGRNAVRVAEAASGREVGVVLSPGWPGSLAFSPDGGRLACAFENTALVWDVAALTAAKPAATRPTAEELAALWDDLTGGDGERAYQAVARLASSGAEGVRFLKKRLEGNAAPDDPRIAKLIKALDDEDFEARERAAAALEALGQKAKDALRRARDASRSAEVRARAERLLAKFDKNGDTPPSAEVVAVRAIEALEAEGAPEARDVLKELADGDKDSERTRAAKGALERLKRREASAP